MISKEKLMKMIQDHEIENPCDYGVSCKNCPHDSENIEKRIESEKNE